MKEILFISDLHLSEHRPELTRAFLHFLEHRAEAAGALYILGDFFNLWIGDDCIAPWQMKIAAALKAYSSSHPLYFMHGNRDFFIGQQFCQQAGCTLLPDPTLIKLDDMPVLLLHGDTLCTQDKSYQYYRKLVHSSIAQKIFLSLPQRLRLNIAAAIREKSKKKRVKDLSKLPRTNIQDADTGAVISMFKKKHTFYMIHGHTHRPARHSHTVIDNNGHEHSATRWVLGDWDTHWWVLSYKQKQFSQESYPIS